jgi:hypothetical protein
MSEPVTKSTNGIYLGKTMAYKLPFYLDRSVLINPHMAIIGMSGSGKSYFLKAIVTKSVIYHRASLLAIDWNDEYHELIEFLNGKVLSFGSDFRINVMDVYSGSLGGASNITELIDAMLGLDKEQRSSLHGLLLSLFSEPVAKNLSSLARIAKDHDKVLAGRLAQLFGNPFFADKTEFDMAKVLDGIYSINLSTLRDNSQRAELVRFILRLVIDSMHKMEIGAEKQRILVLDESWRLLKNSDEVGILYREGRKYQLSVICATQMASDINNEIVANSGCLAFFRMQNENDYAIIENIGLIDSIAKATIGSLETGSCMLHLSYKENKGQPSKFCIERILGTEFGRMLINGDSMRYELSYKKFLEITESLCEGTLKDKAASFALQNRKGLDLTSFVRFLSEAGLDRPGIVCYLREIGIYDYDIVAAYEKA